MPMTGSRVQPGFAASAVPARYLWLLADHLVSLGHAVEQPLVAAGLSVAQLSHPAARIDRQQLSKALQQLAAATGRTDLGFELGMQLNLGLADELGQLFLSAPTHAAGLAYASRYLPLMTPSYRLHIERTAEGLHATAEPTRPLPYDVAVMGLEVVLAATYRFAVFISQSSSFPVTVSVSWPAPPHAHRYRELKGVQLRFGRGDRPRLHLLIPTELAERPLPMANHLAARDLEEACERRLRQLSQGQSWTEWVITMLRDVEDRFPTQAELAAQMGISPRTLARALLAEGREYRELAQDLRHAQARQLLRGTALSLAEIAHRLGYSDAANFSRAFRRVEALSPGQFRSAAKAAAAHSSALLRPRGGKMPRTTGDSHEPG
ncbi:AraC family transcriptional regulator ligand-binding domain-containing protein [Ideonella sp. 4Y11]|uniref:AraC family transcriptional regulator ligand-binding domain-containing protein n=1 Tax=Ideonella aquatica TaxID=2824119 RepID=A0A940YDI2_9BURK|nr:AraC family transcriptional regulator [Ideonella aquatica]MBQ0958160.1 AraC family transcriptional regulator ligand-binding domain-containing protein [Ideonella aquatica]